LKALEFFERREVRIAVVEMDDETDGNEIIVEMIEERAAAGAVVERQPSVCWTRPLRCCSGATAKAPSSRCEFLRLAIGPQSEALDQHLGKAAARTLGE